MTREPHATTSGVVAGLKIGYQFLADARWGINSSVMPEKKLEKFAGKYKSPQRRRKPPCMTALGHKVML